MLEPVFTFAIFGVGFFMGMYFRDSVDWLLLRLKKRDGTN